MIGVSHLSDKISREVRVLNHPVRENAKNGENVTFENNPAHSKSVFESRPFSPRNKEGERVRVIDSPPPVPPRIRQTQREASGLSRWPSDSDLLRNTYFMVQDIPVNNQVAPSQAATISLRGGVRAPGLHSDQRQAPNFTVNSVNRGHGEPQPIGHPPPESVEFSQWDGTLRSPGSAETSQVQHAVYSRPTHGGSIPESSRSYKRLSNVSAVVPLSGLSPFGTGFTRASLSTTGHGASYDHPNFPTSGESVISHRTTINGATLSFHHIRYEVKMKKMPWSRAVTRTVLDDVSGILRPGVNAIMGPTGSGKSSLLDVLAGRKDPRFLSGQVLVDGAPQPKNFKCVSGYVVQDDIVMGTLTVRENLYFSAALRMTLKCSKAERKQKVNEIIEELGLAAVADSKIGTDLIRGVSGGERKRTNIGMELITDPSVLFLDEPTTGLDAFMAGQVVKTLKTLSRRGRTIIFSIHQPKYSIYKLFDSLTLVYRGRLVYHGPARHHPIRYFINLGYECENHNNPPDFFMDILHGEAPQRAMDGVDLNHTIEEPEQMHLVGERLVREWDQSAECQSVLKEANAIASGLSESSNNLHKTKRRKNASEISYAVPFCRQLNQVCWRTSVNLLRDPLASIVQTVVYLFFAVSMGTVYFKMNKSLESGIQNRAGLFFFSTLQVVFVNLGSIELFIKERVLFIHENSSGYYRVSVYFFSKIMCDILPTKVLPVLVFMPICYWMAGLRADAAAFFFFELILSLTTLAAAAIALFISATFTLFGIANVVVSIVYVFMMVFGGYLINLKSMGAWLSWLRYLSIFRYSLGGLMVMEMNPLQFCPATNTSTPQLPDTRQCQPGTQYLYDQDIGYETPWDLWMNVFGQIMITLGFYVLCYIQLRRIKKYK
ncbi:Placenta-specific ATP-binding cassette transporter [Fasciola gigantica]|uniref:Placenta-specific ATP-binding cassette transporter n=1 Tax=Fasciola gigantica TaxID=46835 RepID=A0A504YX08_FASGI|nr:Placenta-specific ATP-binding cassette transporter [Fasciola gigantica]